MNPSRTKETLRRLISLLVAFESPGLQPMDYLILEFLRDRRGASQVAIGARMTDAMGSITPSNISRRVTRLQAQGYVRRKPGPDERTKKVVTTRKGKVALRSFDELLRSVFPVDELTPVAVLVGCPGCETRLRLKRFGPKYRITCPKCGQKFHAIFEDGQCSLAVETAHVRPEEPLRDPYTVLGVPHNASSATRSEARRSLLKKYHPDLFHALGPEFVSLATRKSQAINHAYDEINK